MRLILSLLVVLQCGLSAFGQNEILLLPDGAQPNNLYTCQETVFNMLITKSGGFAGSDETVLSFHLPEGMELVSISGTGASIIGEDSVLVKGITASPYQLSYTLKPKCGFFSANTISGVSHSISASFNGTEQISVQSLSYSIDAPLLVFREDLSLNLNYSLAEFGITYTRRYVWVNTGLTPFNGLVEFQDVIREDASVASLQIQDINLIYPSATITLDQVSDTSAFLNFNVNNLEIGDSIVIEEEVVVIGCEKEDSYADFSLKYGCFGEVACEEVEFAPASFGIIDQNKKPALVNSSPFVSGYNLLTPSYSGCVGDPQLRELEIRNVGTGSASNVRFTAYGVSWLYPSWNYFSKIDTLSITVIKMVGGIEVPVPFHKLNYVNKLQQYTTDNNYQQYFVEYETDEVLGADEFIIIRYNELVKCIDESEYDDLFNVGKRFSNAYIGAYLNHPCLATPTLYVDPLISVNYGGQQHSFNFNQSMYNLDHPAVTDHEEIWLEANDLSTFNLGFSNPAGFAYDMNTAEMLVRIDVEPGFEVIDNDFLDILNDSVYLYSSVSGVEWPWYASSVEYFGNITNGNADGGYLLAHFSFPDTFYVDAPSITDNFGRQRTKYYGNRHNPTNFFTQFFSDFNVRFKLKSHCDKAQNSVSAVTESLFFVPNVTCDPDCRMPLSRAGDVIKFLCPGCILPGFNVTQFNLERANVGYADANDDHFPDALPFVSTSPDLNDIERKHLLIGDTLNLDLMAVTSDGQNYRFDNINAVLDEGQVFVTGDFLKNLKFIGATGAFNGESMSIPDHAGLFSDGIFALPNAPINVFSIDVGATALASYGITGMSQFQYEDSIRINAQFVVVKNLVNGSIGNPKYSPEELNSFVYMSGEPFTGYRQRQDANELLKPVPTDNYGSLTTIEREALDYWCTGGIARLLGVGVDLNISVKDDQYGPNLTYPGFGIQNVSTSFPQVDPCYKTMMIENYVGIGEVAGSYYYPYQTQNLIDAFPNELRNLWKPTSAEVNFPGKYYELDRVFVNYGFQVYNEQTNSHTYRRYMMDIPANDPNITLVDSMASIDLLHFYDERTGMIPIPNGYVTLKDSILRFDEGMIGEIFWSFKMKDCEIPDTVYFGGADYEEKIYFSDFIFSEGRDTVITRNYSNNRFFDKPSAELYFNPLDIETVDGNWTVELATDEAFLSGGTSAYNYDNFINNNAQNSFLYFVSPSGNIQVNQVTNAGVVVPQVGNINGSPLFGVGLIGANGKNSTYKTADIAISSIFTCENVVDRDSLMVIYGWNCYGYPSSIEEACFKDTSWLYINLLETGLQSQLLGSSNIQSCAENEYRILLHPTGYNNVENLMIEANLSQGLSYVIGSAYVEQAGQTEAIEPQVLNFDLTWDLNELVNMLSNFSSASPDAYLVFKVEGGCETGGSDLVATVNATNYCNKPLPEISLSKHLNNSTGVASEIVSIDHSNMCNGNNWIDIQINNGQQTDLDLTVIDANSNLPIGSLQVTGLAAGTIANYQVTLTEPSTHFYIQWNSCSCSDHFEYSYTCNEPCDPDANFTVENVCKGLNVMPIPASSDGTHSWTFSYLGQTSSLTNPVFPVTQSGLYTITHTVTLVCGETATSTQQVEVYQPEYTSIVMIGNSPICEGETVTLTVANAGNFTGFDWSTGETTAEIIVSTGGYYQVDVTDANGCVSHCSSITISETDRPDDQSQTIYICSATDQVNLDAGSGYGAYHWLFNGATSQSVSVTGPGVYVAEICNAANPTCCGTFTFNVELEQVAFPLIDDVIICPGTTATVNSPIIAEAYSWEYNSTVISTTPQADVTDIGTYTLTITTEAGCNYSQSFEVYHRPTAMSEFTVPVEMCLTDGQICVSPDVNDVGYLHQWIFTQNGNVLLDTDQAEPCLTLTQAGLIEVEHTVNNECGTSSSIHTINIQDEIADEHRIIYICAPNQQITLDAGAGFGSYQWDIPGTSGQTATVSGPGVYTVSVCNGSTKCCGTITFEVMIESLSFDVADIQICPNTSTTVMAPVQGISYSWVLNNVEESNTDQLQISEAGTYQLIITTANGCLFSDQFEATLLPLPVSSFSSSDIICTTSDATCFTPEADEPGYDHHWIFTQNSTSMHFYEVTPCVDFSSAGIVTIEHIVSNACGTSSTTSTIEVVEVVDGGCIEIIGQNPMCPGSTVTLTTSGSYVSVEWHDGNGNIIGYGNSITVSSAGVYSATATDANGCVSTCICTTLSEVKVSYQHLDDLILCPGQTGHQYIKGNGIWSTGTYGDTEIFTEAGHYYVDIVSPEGCPYREEFDVNYANLDATIVIQDAKSQKESCNYKFIASGVSGSPVTYDWYLDGTYLESGQEIIYEHTGLGIINAEIKLVITDSYGCRYEFIVNRNFKPCMGIISAGGLGPKMIVAPNPFDQGFNVSYALGSASKGELKLVDLRNKEVFSAELSTITDQVYVDVSHISSGTYMLQLYGDGMLIESQRIVKIK